MEEQTYHEQMDDAHAHTLRIQLEVDAQLDRSVRNLLPSLPSFGIVLEQPNPGLASRARDRAEQRGLHLVDDLLQVHVLERSAEELGQLGDGAQVERLAAAEVVQSAEDLVDLLPHGRVVDLGRVEIFYRLRQRTELEVEVLELFVQVVFFLHEIPRPRLRAGIL